MEEKNDIDELTVNENTDNENKKSKKPIEIKFINVLIITIISLIILLVLLVIIVMQYEKNNNLKSEISILNYQIEKTKNTVPNNMELEDEIESEIKKKNTEDQENETDNVDKFNNSVSQINDIDASNNAVDDINKEGNKIDWEEYPDNICQDMEKIGLSNHYGIFLSDKDNNKNWVKTLWSYYKNGYRDESYIYQYSVGDSTESIRHESNYPQYNDYCSNNTIYKYSDKITYEIAALNEDLYAFSNMEGKNEKEQEREQAKMESARNAKIGETVAYQWNNLKNLKNYNGRSDLNSENYYYEIDKMVIMNGYNYSEYWYKTNARAKKIKVTINSDKEYIFDLNDTNRAQEFNIDYKQNNVERPVSIEIEVLEKYNGNLTDDVFISDIQFVISSNIPQGR